MVTQNADSSCTGSNNKRIGACFSMPLVISVSGITGVSVPDEPGFLTGGNPSVRSLSFANTSQTTTEVCGQSGLSVNGPVNPYEASYAGLWAISSTLQLYAWFSPYDSLHDNSSDRCGTGSVRFRVELTLSRVYNMGSYTTGYRLEYKGFHKSDCTSLDSYSGVSNMLAGKSVTMTCDGTFSIPGNTYEAVPQTITVSFAANPLP